MFEVQKMPTVSAPFIPPRIWQYNNMAPHRLIDIHPYPEFFSKLRHFEFPKSSDIQEKTTSTCSTHPWMFVDSFGFLPDNFLYFPAVAPPTPWPPSSPVWVSSWRLMALCRSEVMAGQLIPVGFPYGLIQPLISGGGLVTGGGRVGLWATRWPLGTNQLMLWEVYPRYKCDTIGNIKFLTAPHILNFRMH